MYITNDDDLFFLLAGNYTVVASTFEPDLLGQFILTVASNIKVNVDPIPSEGAVRKEKLNFYIFYFILLGMDDRCTLWKKE